MSGLSLSRSAATVSPATVEVREPEPFDDLLTKVSSLASRILIKKREYEGYKQDANLFKRRLDARPASQSELKEIRDGRRDLAEKVSKISDEMMPYAKDIRDFERSFKRLRGDDEGSEPAYQEQMNEIRSSRDFLLRDCPKTVNELKSSEGCSCAVS